MKDIEVIEGQIQLKQIASLPFLDMDKQLLFFETKIRTSDGYEMIDRVEQAKLAGTMIKLKFKGTETGAAHSLLVVTAANEETEDGDIVTLVVAA